MNAEYITELEALQIATDSILNKRVKLVNEEQDQSMANLINNLNKDNFIENITCLFQRFGLTTKQKSPPFNWNNKVSYTFGLTGKTPFYISRDLITEDNWTIFTDERDKPLPSTCCVDSVHLTICMQSPGEYTIYARVSISNPETGIGYGYKEFKNGHSIPENQIYDEITNVIKTIAEYLYKNEVSKDYVSGGMDLLGIKNKLMPRINNIVEEFAAYGVEIQPVYKAEIYDKMVITQFSLTRPIDTIYNGADEIDGMKIRYSDLVFCIKPMGNTTGIGWYMVCHPIENGKISDEYYQMPMGAVNMENSGLSIFTEQPWLDKTAYIANMEDLMRVNQDIIESICHELHMLKNKQNT